MEQAVHEKSNVAVMNYKASRVEEEEKEIKELEAQRIGVTEEEKVELAPEEETFKKRYGDLRRHMQSKDSQYTEEVTRLKEQLDSVTKKQVKLPKSDEELDDWAQKYPDVAKIVETIATKKVTEARKEVDEKLAYVDQMQKKIKTDKAEQELSTLHPDYAELRNDKDFHDWVGIQPKWIQQALYDNETDFLAASKAIDLYKMESAPKPTAKDAAKNVSRPRRSEEPVIESKSKWSETKVKKLRPDEYENLKMILWILYEKVSLTTIFLVLPDSKGELTFYLTNKN